MTEPENPHKPASTETEAEDGGKKPRKAAIFFILVTLFIDILGIGIIIPVLPSLVRGFLSADGALSPDNLTSQTAWFCGLLGVSYAVMQFIFAPILGALSDRFGRRPIILGSLFGFGVDFIVQGFAPSLTWLFAGRIFAGIMGASFTTANAYIADVSTQETRARNFGFVGAAFGLGFILGPTFGGLLGEYWTRLPFFVSAGLALVNWLYGYFVLPESLPPEKRSTFHLRKANPFSAVSRLRAYPIVAGLAVVFVLTSLAQRGLENVWVQFAEHRYGWTMFTNGLVLGLVGVMAMIVQGGLVRPAIKRFGERKAALIGVGISAVAFLGYAMASQGWMVPCIIVFGAFGGIAGPAIQSIVAGTVDPGEQGKIQGAMTSLQSLTSIAAPALFTSGLFTYFTSSKAPVQLPGAPFYFGSVLWVIALVVLWFVFAKFPKEEADAVTT